MACPNEQRLLDYVDGGLLDAEHDAVDAHVDRCRRCQMAVAQLAGEGDEPEAAVVEPRYSIVRELGAGAMGIVYEAIDQRLARRVAIKMIRPQLQGDNGSSAGRTSADARGRLRIAREGRALARLHHPNIVAIYDIGTIDGETYVAMEYVDGVTLRSELASGPLDWRRAVDLTIAIAEAVAAAHSVGVVHRDLKPDNVMLEDGIPKVLDFGLAHAPEEPPTGEVPPLVSHGSRPLPDVTASGMVVGTPAYMAPEAMRGERSDERSDQYSLIVMLFEMVYGRRPFLGTSLADLWSAKHRRITTRVEGLTAPPRWLRRAIDRGLAPKPEERFADLRQLTEVLERGRQPSPRRTGLVVVGGALVGLTMASIGDEAATCRGAAERVAAVYSDTDRNEIALALGTDRPDSVEGRSGVDVVAALDDYAERWANIHSRTCRAAWVRDELSLAEFESIATCLDASLQSMSAVVETARQGRSTATELYAALGDLESCDTPADVGFGGRTPFRRALIERLARANTLGTLGRNADVAELALPIAEQARRVGLPDVEAQARFILGIAHQDLQQFEEAADALRDAYFIAGRSDEHALASNAAASLAYVLGWGQGEGESALRWLSHAGAASERAGVAQGDSLSLVVTHGLLLDLMGRPAEALRFHRRALALCEAPPAGADVKAAANHLGTAHMNLANALAALDEPEQAAVHYREGINVNVERFGRSHPSTLTAELNAALFSLERGHNEEALAAFDALEPRMQPTQQPTLRGHMLGARGTVLRRMGRHDEAVQCQAAALSLFEEVYGELHPQVASNSLNLSIALQAAGRCDEALAAAQRAQQLASGTSAERAGILVAVAGALACLERYESAYDAAEAAVDALGRDAAPSPVLADSLRAKAIAAERLDRHREARVAFERALSLVDVIDASDELRTELLEGVLRSRQAR